MANDWPAWSRLIHGPTDWPAVLEEMHDHPELDATRGLVQSPQWHPEGDVLTHLGLAALAAARHADRDGLVGADREVAVLGALVHDLGKPLTTRREPDGRITSHGHAEKGVDPARRLLERIGAPREVVRRILPVVREHMAPASVTGRPSRHAVLRLQRRLEDAGSSLADWARVVDADRAGRGGTPRPSPAEQWLAIAREPR